MVELFRAVRCDSYKENGERSLTDQSHDSEKIDGELEPGDDPKSRADIIEQKDFGLVILSKLEIC